MRDAEWSAGYITGVVVGGAIVYVFCKYVLFPPSKWTAPAPARIPVAPWKPVVTPEAIAFHDELHHAKGKKA